MNTPAALHILVVDDSPKLRRLIAMILRQDGYVVETVGTAPEGIAHLERAGYELVISDLSPDSQLNGLALAQQVRRGWPAVRFILATGSPADFSAAEQAHWCVDVLLRKPFTTAQLREAVARIGANQ